MGARLFLDLRCLEHFSVLALESLMDNFFLNRKAITIDFVELLHNLLSFNGLLLSTILLLLNVSIWESEELVCLLLNSTLFIHPLSLLFSASSFLLIRAGAIVTTRSVFLALLLFSLPFIFYNDVLLTIARQFCLQKS